jgi:hypothetical protein
MFRPPTSPLILFQKRALFKFAECVLELGLTAQAPACAFQRGD